MTLAMTRTAISAGSERVAIGLGRGTATSFGRRLLDEGFRRDAIPYRTPTFDGLGFSYSRGASIAAIQRVGNSVIDQSGRIGLFEFNTDVGWTGPRIVYDSQWDDRNPAGGMTPSGAIVTFFARYDANGDRWIDTGFIRSIDGGGTWSDFRRLPVPGGSRWYSPYGPMIELGNRRLMQTFYGSDGGKSYLWAMFSADDGETWNRMARIADSFDLRLSEPSAAVLPAPEKGQILLVARSERRLASSPPGGLVQYESADNGRTWRYRGRVSASASEHDISPWLFRSGARVHLLFTERSKLRVAMSQLRVGRRSFTWSEPVGLYYSRLAAAPRSIGNFGYPSISFITLDGASRLVVVLFDSAPSDERLGSEKDPANADLVMVPFPNDAA